MEMAATAASWLLALDYLLISAALALNHARVQRARRRLGVEEGASLRDPRSMKGLALEGLAFLIAVFFRRSPQSAPVWALLASMVFGALAAVLMISALRHLDLHWRVKAVVTEDHRLITTGPYALVRHPIFAGLLCLLLATVLLLTRPWAAVVAMAVGVYGTEIRVRAEDGLLERRFGEQFRRYKAGVAALVPFLR